MSSGRLVRTKPQWHLFDAREWVVGRLANRICNLVQGKHKPTYTPNQDVGDNVVVLNVRDIGLTGRKFKEKKYYWHTGFPGGLKTTTPEQLARIKKRPELILQKAVYGMLPKNKLRRIRMRRVFIYHAMDFPYWDQFTQEQREMYEAQLEATSNTPNPYVSEPYESYQVTELSDEEWAKVEKEMAALAASTEDYDFSKLPFDIKDAKQIK